MDDHRPDDDTQPPEVTIRPSTPIVGSRSSVSSLSEVLATMINYRRETPPPPYEDPPSYKAAADMTRVNVFSISRADIV